jgi:hypothetical protein
MKKFIYTTLFLVVMLMTGMVQAQVGINEDNSQPDASALLDVKSSTKGMLVPRMTTTQRNLISNPATGLLVFDTTTGSFWFYNGSWTDLSSSLSDADNDTKIQVEESADEDKIRFDLEGSERLVLEKNAGGGTIINLPNNSTNTFFGQNAGSSNTGDANTFIGDNAGTSNTTGSYNVFSGYRAGALNLIGASNTIIGGEAGENSTGGLNTFIGNVAGRLSTGDRNTFVGMASGLNNTGDRNSFFGQDAGVSNTGSNNVFLGYQAGANSGTDSDKLFIDNTNTSTPLIWGDFSTDILRVNGTLNVNNAFSFPTADGSTGQVLTTDGSGVLTWNTSTSTDDQTIDVLNLNGTTLEISLEGDGQATQTLDLYNINSSCGLKIGDTHAGGIIFYLDASGCHGLVAAASDQSSGIVWWNGSYEDTYAYGNGIGAGEGNGHGIRRWQGNCVSCYASELCQDLSLGGYTDWYLPSKYELNLMYMNIGQGNSLGLGNVGGFAADWYWSSTEGGSDDAWAQYFGVGNQFSGGKESNIYVRAVRAF